MICLGLDLDKCDAWFLEPGYRRLERISEFALTIFVMRTVLVFIEAIVDGEQAGLFAVRE